MKLDIPWETLEPFLKVRKQQSNLSLIGHKGRFKTLIEWFKDKEFDATNFDAFIYYEVDKAGKSASTYNNYLKLVKHIASFLKIESEFKDYHFRDDHTGAPERVITWEQITKLAECEIVYLRFKDRKDKHKALIYFLGTVGSRIEETLNLEWRDIQQGETPIVHFRKEITKNNKERDCPIPQWLCNMLLNLPKESNLIFHQIEATRFRQNLEERSKKVGLPFVIRPHDLRDSSINNKLEYGVALEKVTAYHGHATTNTTYRYYIRIQAKQMAQALYQKDPAFKNDQTFENLVEAVQGMIEGMLNSKICNYELKESLNPETNKKEIWIGLIEK